MKKVLYTALAVLMLASCQQNKIGFVDTGKVINEYQKKVDIEAKYEAKNDVFKKKTDSVGQALQKEAQAFQSKVSKMSQSKQQEAYQTLMHKRQQLQQQFQSEQQQLTKAYQTEIDSVISTVKDYIKNYGETNSYSYILGTSDATSNVLYGADANDLTQTVLDGLNAEYNK